MIFNYKDRMKWQSENQEKQYRSFYDEYIEDFDWLKFKWKYSGGDYERKLHTALKSFANYNNKRRIKHIDKKSSEKFIKLNCWDCDNSACDYFLNDPPRQIVCKRFSEVWTVGNQGFIIEKLVLEYGRIKRKRSQERDFEVIAEYVKEHPGCSQREVARETGISRPMVKKWFYNTIEK